MVSVLALVLSLPLLSLPSTVQAHEPPQRRLTFQDRLAAQAAIERVYLLHQAGATRSLERAAPQALLAKKVRTYLKQSQALERFWDTPVTTAMLMDEARRMAAGTRMPERLRELHAALGDDPVLVLECLVRPALVDRLIRERVGGGAEGWSRWWVAMEPNLDESPVSGVVAEGIALPGISTLRAAGAADLATDPLAATSGTGCALPYQFWDAKPTPDVRYAPRSGSQTVWTGSLVLIMGSGYPGERYDPVTDTSTPMAAAPSYVPLGYVRTAWTGTEMVVLSGFSPSNGGRYDPVADTWRSIATAGGPSARDSYVLVAAGERVIVWGGRGYPYVSLQNGGIYDLVTDTWSPVSATGAPQISLGAVAVWTGSRMIVWGGLDNQGNATATGAGFDPQSNLWHPISPAEAPEGRTNASAVWSGTEMIVWGGYGPAGARLRTGGRYDPQADTWRSTLIDTAPEARGGHVAVWTGTEMLVWGGHWNLLTPHYGGRYDPATDTWRPMSNAGEPPGSISYSASAAWTGAHLVIWTGGSSGTGSVAGGRYDPAIDAWLPSTGPATRYPATTRSPVWTGNEMILWGGPDGYVGSIGVEGKMGARYDPVLDLWRGMALPPEDLAPRGRHSVIWTGDELIVWGGRVHSSHLQSGGRYDPIADAWTLTSMTGAPEARSGHSAIWTGSEMIVWGGEGAGSVTETSGPSVFLATGGRYDPVRDEWGPIATAGAPGPRAYHTGLWTGSRMLIWGGHGSSGGSRYDPVADQWSPITISGSPIWRERGTVIWSGTEMIVWGGVRDFDCQPYYSCPTWLAAGGRYDPVSNSWRAVSTVGGPSPRADHSAVWTGTAMIVWGGLGPNPYPSGSARSLNTGGAYDPAANVWRPTSLTRAPSPSGGHAAVWADDRMVVWAGGAASAHYLVDTSVDDDGDCVGIDYDCDDANPAIYPDAPAVCGDGFNNNCLHPQWPFLTGTNELDDDGDAITECAGDCDDTRAAVYPGAPQICDGRNNDCLAPLWPSIRGTNEISDDGDPYSECGGDCDDTRATVYGGAPQICGDGINNDCVHPGWPGVGADETDDDRDGLSDCLGDCDDAQGAVYPGAPQICGDGLNNDCNHVRWPSTLGTNEFDDDGDSFTECAGDCQDSIASVYSGAPEVCDLRNNDCLSPTWPTAPPDNFDRDFDGFAACADCDDTRQSVRPGAHEICGDNLNNDCNHPAWPALVGLEVDADGDLFAPCTGDCDDTRAAVHPYAPQTCDGLNNDCYRQGWPSIAGTNETDNDGDGLSICQSDCDDADAAVWVPTPGEAQDLRVSTGGTLLTWAPLSVTAGLGLVRYDLIRVPDAPTLFVAFGQCIEGGGSDTQATDLEYPFDGGIFYYLVRARGSCGAGPAGYDSSGSPIAARVCP